MSGSRTFAVVGATGSVGRSVADTLQSLGHRVRPVARRAGVSFDDADAVARAFADVDGAFLMVPFDRGATDLHRREDEVGAKLASAVSAAAVPRIVFLSGTSAHLRERAGSATGAAMMEERLDRLQIPELVHLRGAFFMENLLQGVREMAGLGTFSWPFAPDRPTPMVAAGDVGRRAAELLVGPSSGERVQELLGAREYTMAEAVGILGAAVGRPGARYVQLTYEQAGENMIRAGLSASFAHAVIATARSFNDGEIWAKEPRSPRNTARTTLQQFAAEIFAPTYRAEVAAIAS